MSGCVYDVYYRPWSPYVHKDVEMGGRNFTIKEKGILVNALEVISKKINARFNINWSKTDFFDIKCPKILDKNFDECEATYPHFSDEVTWYVPADVKIPRWQGIIRIFHLKMWVLVLLVFLLGSLVNFFQEWKENENILGKLTTAVLNLIRLYLAMGIKYKIKGKVASGYFILLLFYLYKNGLLNKRNLVSFVITLKQNSLSGTGMYEEWKKAGCPK